MFDDASNGSKKKIVKWSGELWLLICSSGQLELNETVGLTIQNEKQSCNICRLEMNKNNSKLYKATARQDSDHIELKSVQTKYIYLGYKDLFSQWQIVWESLVFQSKTVQAIVKLDSKNTLKIDILS